MIFEPDYVNYRDPEWLRREVEARGFHLKHQETHNVPDSQFWAALFQRTER